MIYFRKKTETVKIVDLFKNCNLNYNEEINYILPFKINVLTPFGYKKINKLFTIKNKFVVINYFSNGKTLKTSTKHRIMANNEWKYVKNINNNDIIETKNGITTLKKQYIIHKKQILFDLEVDDVNCYYSNEILSHNSWQLANIGTEALKQGKIVFHYTLELSKEMITKRYYSRFTDIYVSELKFNEIEIEKSLNNLNEKKGKLLVKEYPPKRATINTLTSHIERSIQLGLKPDLIIVDYGDLLKAPRFYKDKRLEIGNIYEELRGMSGDFNTGVWTVSQVNRSGAESDVIVGEQISEDYSKIMIGDFIFSVSRKEIDSESKTARIFIIKNRFGVDKIRFPAQFNVNNGKLSIFESNSLQGKILNEKMNGNSLTKKLLKEKYFKDKN